MTPKIARVWSLPGQRGRLILVATAVALVVTGAHRFLAVQDPALWGFSG